MLHVINPCLEVAVAGRVSRVHRDANLHTVPFVSLKDDGAVYILIKIPPWIWFICCEIEKVPRLALRLLPTRLTDQEHVTGEAVLSVVFIVFSCDGGPHEARRELDVPALVERTVRPAARPESLHKPGAAVVMPNPGRRIAVLEGFLPVVYPVRPLGRRDDN